MQPAEGFSFVSQPDLGRASKIICDTWARPCWNYDVGLLSLHIMRPSGDATLALGQESADGQLASFQAYMPFDVAYQNRNFRSVFASFLTVAADFHGKGLAGPQQGELLERAIDQGYDLYITMCEVGAASNRAVEKIFARKEIEVKVVNVLQYLVGVRAFIAAKLTDAATGHTRPYTHADNAAVSELVRSMGSGADLRKLIPNEDVDFLFVDRPHSKTYLYDDGSIRALANLLFLEVLEPDGGKSLNVYFDNVNFGDLRAEERTAFVGDILRAIDDTGYQTALMPDLGYVDSAVFRQFNFRLAPRQINLYIAPLKAGLLPDGITEVESFYMDVY